jgi:hypothetical protein
MNNFLKGLLLLSVPFISSCEKNPNDDDTIVFGRIIDSKTNQPIQGAVILRISGSRDIAFYSDTTIVAQSDLDGKYEFKQKLTYSFDNETYTNFVAHYENYYDSYLNVKIGSINNCNIKLVKNSFLKLHIKNSMPYNADDLFSIYINSNGDLSYLYNVYGANVDTTFVLIALPNYTHSIYWSAHKNNITTLQNSENIYFSSGDTIYRSIIY